LVNNDFNQIVARFDELESTDPQEAINQARSLILDGPHGQNFKVIRAAVLVNVGVAINQQDAVQEGLALYREIYESHQTPAIRFSLATAIISSVDITFPTCDWIHDRESTRILRAEARSLFWEVAQSRDADDDIRTQSWTNLANQLSVSCRLSEAHDARLTALKLDPENGVAAASAIRYLMSCYQKELSSEMALAEASVLAKIARENPNRIVEYAGARAAASIAAFVEQFPDPPARAKHRDPFVSWVEQGRLTLSPTVELIDPDVEKLDWLTLPPIREKAPMQAATLPPIFAMFNQIKSDFILARDLAWRSIDDRAWPRTGRFADTLDGALYGPAASALSLAHRTALDLLDKIAVTANYHFELGHNPSSISFGKIWRTGSGKLENRVLNPKVEDLIREGVKTLYGLVELADDYDAYSGRLRPLKDVRNASTHRFVLLHEHGSSTGARSADEIQRYSYDEFRSEANCSSESGKGCYSDARRSDWSVRGSWP
jgi:hypothetical protein